MSKKRRKVFRPGKGRAFLHFLMGELVLVVVCSCLYLFVLQGKPVLPVALTVPTGTPDATEMPTATKAPTAAEMPTVTEVPEPLSQPTSLSEASWLNDAEDGLEITVTGFGVTYENGRYVLRLAGSASCGGAWPEETYVLLCETVNGSYAAMYPADGSNGTWRAAIDITGYDGVPYRVLLAARYGGRTLVSPLDENSDHFCISGGTVRTPYDQQ